MSQLIFYDVDDLATVAAGEMEPWEPQPYATLELDPWLWGVSDSRQKHHVGAIAYDSVHRRLFLMEPLVDADRPLVHVWSVN